MTSPARAGPQETPAINHGGVEGDGIAEVGTAVHHLDQEGLARRHIEGVDEALKNTQSQNLRHRDTSGESQRSEYEGPHGGEELSDQQAAPPLPPVRPDARHRTQQEGRDLAGERHHTQQKRRACQTIDQPTGGETGHPRADQGNALAAEEEPEVAVA